MDINKKSTLVVKPLLHKGLSGKPRKEARKYQTTAGMLNHFQGNSCKEISTAVHQTVRFYNNQMLSHEKDIKHLGR